MPPLDQIGHDDGAAMSFGDHLDELRSRLIRALIVPVPLMFLTYAFSRPLMALIVDPIREALRDNDLPDALQVLGPAEALLTQLKISILAAVLLSLPWILWQAWQFIRPGLYKRERRFVYFLVPGSTLLTAAGILLFYLVMLPFVLLVLIRFGTVLDDEMTVESLRAGAGADAVVVERSPLRLPVLDAPPKEIQPGDVWLQPNEGIIVALPAEGGASTSAAGDPTSGAAPPVAGELRKIPLYRQSAIAQEFRLTYYINFVLMMMFGMVIAFQTPLVMLLLGWLDLVRAKSLRKNRKMALFVTAIVAAVLTPTTDPWSMLAMWVPLYLLFELGIVLMVWFPAKRVAEGVLGGEKPEAGRSERER
jgi:sec-independent protein translocase protein TatC